MNDQPNGYTCSACGCVLKTEAGFLKHKCKQMQREKDLHSIDGQIAYEYYSRWIRQKKKGSHTILTFKDSRYFTSIFQFTKWTRRVNIPDVDRYISFMILKKYDPPMWMDDQAYVEYLQHLDKMCTVDDHVAYTIKTLQSIAKQQDCNLPEALGKLTSGEMLQLVRQRKLSPWVLVHMESFKMMVGALTEFDQIHFVNTIKPKFWKAHIKANPVGSDEIKQVCEVLKL